ncbi:MAG: hypothetical protein QXU18_05110 [Thermoplasmatales archaeon]
MMKGYEATKTREEFFEFLKENMSFVITKVPSDRAEGLMEEMELV